MKTVGDQRRRDDSLLNSAAVKTDGNDERGDYGVAGVTITRPRRRVKTINEREGITGKTYLQGYKVSFIPLHKA